jgi:hypothetical protein
VIHFLGAGGQQTPEDKYCAACRQLDEDDCANCDRSAIEVLDHE